MVDFIFNRCYFYLNRIIIGDKMSRIDQTCTISGLRQNKLPSDLDYFDLCGRIDGEIRKSILQGYTTFQTGMAMGIDIWAAEIVLKLKLKFPELRLICYLPCETQAYKWPNHWREKYFDALAGADDVICLQARYTAGCMQRRNRVMIDRSSRLIAVHDGASSSVMGHTIRYAKTQGLDIVIINPDDCLQVLPWPQCGRL
jgi:uncharacterized phage-like protein YoqJ